MFRSTYEELAKKFTMGRNTETKAGRLRNATTYWDELSMFDTVSIPDLLRLYHKRSGSIGILTKIGAETIGMRDNVNGSEIIDSYKAFYFLDDQGAPVVPEIVRDRFGKRLVPGESYVAFAAANHLLIGRVEKFTPIGTVMILMKTRKDKWEIAHKALNGQSCIVLDEHMPEVVDFKLRFND